MWVKLKLWLNVVGEVDKLVKKKNLLSLLLLITCSFLCFPAIDGPFLKMFGYFVSARVLYLNHLLL